MPNRQIQDQQPLGNRNPGGFAPDDEEELQEDVTTAADQDPEFERGRGPRSAQPTSPAEADEEVDDDADSTDDDVDDDDEEDEEAGGDAGQL